MSRSYAPEAMQIPNREDGTERWVIVEGGYIVVGFDDAAYFPSREACEAEIAEREKRGLILREMFKTAKLEPGQ